MARKVIVGAGLLIGGAVLVDVGYFVGEPMVERIGNIAMILAGIGLLFLPAALGPTPRLGRSLYGAGIVLASLVDVPAVLDPSDLRAGRLLGFPAMLLLTAGLVLLWRRTRIAALLVGAAWFFVQLAPNVLLFIIPNERPSFVLQVIGVAVALAVAATHRSTSQVSDRSPGDRSAAAAAPATRT